MVLLISSFEQVNSTLLNNVLVLIEYQIRNRPTVDYLSYFDVALIALTLALYTV